MALSNRTRKVLAALAGIVFVGWLAFAVHALLGVGEGAAFDNWLYDALMGAAGIACLLRAKLVKTEQLAWLLFGTGLMLWTAGEIYWSVFLTGKEEVPIPSPADLLYLALYPALYVALFQLGRARLGHVGRRMGLDGAIAALAVASLAIGAAFGPIFGAAEGQTLEVATNLAYPLGDVVLVGLVVGMTALAGRRPGLSWALLATGLGLMAFGDSTYVLQSLSDTYVEGGALDLIWPTAALLVAVAAWVPAQPGARSRAGRRVSTMPIACALVAVATAVLASIADFNLAGQLLSAVALVAVAGRMAVAVLDNQRLLDRTRHDADTDALTGLANRRRLLDDLTRVEAQATDERPWLLALFDLNGFKRYNDVYGHPAGDQLLARLGQRLADALGTEGRAYRLGGDEFCVLAEVDGFRSQTLLKRCHTALSELGEGFSVDAAHGAVALPTEAPDTSGALQLADTRMYSTKRGGRASASVQTCRALVTALAEGRPDLQLHLEEVAEFASAVAFELKMSAEERDEVRRAAQLHDLGKIAIPDAILNKPGPLDEHEWAFMRRHTLIGERILSSAPALAPVGRLVRSSHERIDGGGYPDGLKGDAIPLGARVVAVCDSYEAMTADRPYREAMSSAEAVAELQRCAGAQFDPEVVEVFTSVLHSGERSIIEALRPA